MEEIENVEKTVEEQAKENSNGFNLEKVGVEKVFEWLNKSGLFLEVFASLNGGCGIKDKSQVILTHFEYVVDKESDGKYYKAADLHLVVKSNQFYTSFDLKLTPFTATMSREMGDIDCTKHSERITEEWRKIMNMLFKRKYAEALKEYCNKTKEVKNTKIEKTDNCNEVAGLV